MMEAETCSRLHKRVAFVEGLLREALGALMGDFEVNPHDVLKRIRAALEG
jgi:hypothetical protein